MTAYSLPGHPGTVHQYDRMLLSPNRLFWTLALTHLVVWTLIPTLLHPNAPLDTIESVTWGHQWRWGYEKHPPLSAWLSEIAVEISGKRLWSIFLISQLAVVISFWAAWQLGRELLADERQAVVGALLLEGVYYYNYTSPEFNPNVLQLPLWLCIALSFWCAVTRVHLRYWIVLGICAGLAVLTKYYSGVLLASCGLLLLMTPEGRAQFKKPGVYLAGIIAFVIVLPHLLWVVQHDFTTLQYVARRSAYNGSIGAHVLNALHFALSQLLAIAGALVMVGTMLYGTGTRVHFPKYNGQMIFRNSFPWVVGLGPFVLTMVASVAGRAIWAMWGAPLWGMSGILLMVVIRPVIRTAMLQRFIRAWLALFLLAVTIYTGQLLIRVHSRSQFPGAVIGSMITDQWHERYHKPLEMVGGSLWLGGVAAFYSEDRPMVFVDMDTGKSEWADAKAFAAKGGVLVWEAAQGSDIPAEWRQMFPQAELQSMQSFPWIYHKNKPPFQLGWAIVPPQ